MKNTLLNKIFSILCLLSIPSIGFTKSDGINIQINTLNSMLEFVSTNPSKSEYVQISNSTLVQTIVVGTGRFRVLNQDKTSVSNEFPGRDIGGYSSAQLQNLNGKIYFVYDGLIDDTMSGFKVNVPLNYGVETKIISGSWESYLRGGELILQVTEAGEELIQRVQAKMLTQT